MRTTRRQIDATFRTLCRQLGKAEGWQPGEWMIDHQPMYGGYVVVEYGPGMTESHPLGARRMGATEFYYALWVAIEAVRIATGRDGGE